MEGPYSSPGVRGFIARTLASIRGELEIYLLLCLLLAVLGTAVAWPLLQEFAKIEPMAPGQTEAALAAIGEVVPLALLTGAVMLVVYAGIYLVWIRTVMVGRGHALTSGFLRRLGMVIWRTVSFFGYCVLVLLGLGVVSFVLGTLVGVMGGGTDIVSPVLTIAAMVILIPISLAFYVAVVGSAVDRRMPIFQALKALRGFWGPLIASALIGYIVLVLPSGVMSLAGNLGSEEPNLILTGVSNLFGALANLYLFAVAMTAFREIESRAAADNG